MTETKDPGNKPSGGGRAGKTMTLSMQRTVEKGHVRQSFSHGRSKSVIVETRKKRTIAPPGHAPAAAEAAPAPKPETARPGQPQRSAPPAARKAPDMPRGLSSEEQQARNRALAAFRVRDEQETQLRAEAELRAREAQARQEAEEQARRTAEEAERAAREAESRMSVQAEAPVAEAPAPAPAAPPVAETRPQPSSDRPFGPVIRKPIERPAPVARPDAAAPADTTAERRPAAVARRERTVEVEDSDDSPGRKRGVPGKKVAPERTPPVKRADDRRSTRGRLTIANALDDQQRERSLSALKRRQERAKAKISGAGQVRDKIQREVVIPEAISIQELSNRMAERAVDIIKFLMKQGEMHKITDVIDGDTAELIVTELGHIPKRVSEADVEEGFIGSEDSLEEQTSRAPIVTIMGHVDHGKTSLLDAIRHANVAAGEAGGITQHIGAYQVETPSGQRVTFIDTPGHEAFTAMRARGAKVTDIVILVVAADDGVMPQTVEAINHAKSAGVPMIVAINKIDKPSADPSRVRTDLLKYEVVVESMSGEVLEVEVSALKRINLDKLLEAIALQSEVLELKANPNRSAEGVVIEAKLEAGRGPVGTVLIQRGTLKVGDIIVAGSAWGRVRALISDRGDPVTSAGPSVPVEVLGFSSAPEAGDQLAVVENEARAREITDYRVRKRRDRQAAGAGSMRTLEQMMNQLKGEGRKEFPLLVKGDVQGSVEAINAALEKLGTSEVGARIIHSAVGGITESDISLASASGAVVVGFNVRANAQARAAAERDGVQIRYYNIIYDLVDDVKKAMSGLLAPTVREIFLGNAEILEVFNITKVGKVAGCRVTEGKVERGARVRLIRDNTVIHEGKLSTLKRFKDEVREVPVGQECGMAFENYQDMRQGDVIECFNVETVARSL